MYHVRRSSGNVSRKLSVCIGHSPLVNAQIFGIIRLKRGKIAPWQIKTGFPAHGSALVLNVSRAGNLGAWTWKLPKCVASIFWASLAESHGLSWVVPSWILGGIVMCRWHMKRWKPYRMWILRSLAKRWCGCRTGCLTGADYCQPGVYITDSSSIKGCEILQ